MIGFNAASNYYGKLCLLLIAASWSLRTPSSSLLFVVAGDGTKLETCLINGRYSGSANSKRLPNFSGLTVNRFTGHESNEQHRDSDRSATLVTIPFE